MKCAIALSVLLGLAATASAETPRPFAWVLPPVPPPKFTWSLPPPPPVSDEGVKVWTSPGPTYYPGQYVAPVTYSLPVRYTPVPPPPRVVQPTFRGRSSSC